MFTGSVRLSSFNKIRLYLILIEFCLRHPHRLHFIFTTQNSLMEPFLEIEIFSILIVPPTRLSEHTMLSLGGDGGATTSNVLLTSPIPLVRVCPWHLLGYIVLVQVTMRLLMVHCLFGTRTSAVIIVTSASSGSGKYSAGLPAGVSTPRGRPV